MKKRVIAFALALVVLAQTLVPNLAWARNNPPTKEVKNLVKVGVLDTKNYPKLDNKAILAIQKQMREKSKPAHRQQGTSMMAADSPYLPGQNPTDADKAAAYGNVTVNFATEGLTENGVKKPFQWKEIFGQDSNGNPSKAKIHFLQKDAETGSEINRFTLEIAADGTYNWTDQYGKPAKLPLYSTALEPYRYEVALDYQTSDKITFLTMEIGKSDSKASYKIDADGKIAADIPLSITLGQVASTKFTSEWKTGVEETSRPLVEGLFDNDASNGDIANEIGFFPLPKNNTDETILRNDSKALGEYNGFDEFYGNELRTVPIVKVIEGVDPDTGNATYTLDKANKTITSFDGKKFKYDLAYDVINGGKLTMTEVIPVTFDANGGNFASITTPGAEQKKSQAVEYGQSVDAKVVEQPTADNGKTFIGWGDKQDATASVAADAFKNIQSEKTFYAIYTDDVIEQPGNDKPNNVPDSHVKVVVQLTDKAKIENAQGEPLTGEDYNKAITRIFWVNPKKQVTLPVAKPVGKTVPVSQDNPVEYTWVFKNWTSNESAPRTWADGIDTGITARFLNETTITANYDKNLADNGDLVAEPLKLAESFKDGEGNFVNDFLPSNTDLEAQVKLKGGNPIPNDATVELVLGTKPDGSKYTSLDEELYDKLKEKANPNGEPTRTETVQAKVTFKNGQVQTVDIPLVVYKNIYEAKTLTEKPHYVPDSYKKVTLNPTTKAEDPQKTVFYVNPNAKVAIPGQDPTGTTGNNFLKWTRGNDQYDLSARHQFGSAAEIVAQYVGNIVPQTGNEKPELPNGFVKVITDYNVMAQIPAGKEKVQTFWVKKDVKVTIPVQATPETKTAGDYQDYTFLYWGEKPDGEDGYYETSLTRTFTKAETCLTAIFVPPEILQEGDTPPIHKPKSYVKLVFDPTDKAKSTKKTIYWVKPNTTLEFEIKDPDGKEITTWPATPGQDQPSWKHTGWDAPKDIKQTPDTKKKTTTFKGQYSEPETVIKAIFKGPKWADLDKVPEATAGSYIRYKGQEQLTIDDYKKDISLKDGNTTLVFDENVETTEIVGDNYDKDTVGDHSVTVKLTYKNKATRTIKVPVKVYDTIYPGDTNGNPTKDTPGDGHALGAYVKVTVVPTDKAKNSQTKYYYVNPNAQVTIPEQDPTGKGDNKFVKWTMLADNAAADTTPSDFNMNTPTQFKQATTITAQYVADVIPQTGEDKPNTVPTNYVSVTFVPTDKATDAANKIFWVNPAKDVTIPVNTPTGKQHFTFKEWKMGVNADGAKYTPSTLTKFTENTIITATYDEAKDIIPYDPKDPVTKPDGYVRVSFTKEDGLTLSNVKHYYVKANKGITLGNSTLVKPTVSANTGYKFTAWDKDDTLTITNADIVVKAQSEKLSTVVPEKDDQGKKNEKPAGYVEVTFAIKAEDQTKGNITGVSKFYVNPTEYVTINPPATEAQVGYSFGAWDKDGTIPTVYKTNTTITGSFNQTDAVVPKTKGDDSEKPAGYKTVTFVIEGNGGKINDNQRTTYYVDPNRAVTLTPPATTAETGYTFNEWTPKPTESRKYERDTEIKGTFMKQDDIIPQKDNTGNPNPKPEGYVTVTFLPGQNGTITFGETVYFVNPKADPKVTLKKMSKPTVTPSTGFTADGWDKNDTTEIKTDLTVTAKYQPIKDVIPKEDGGKTNTKPDGYITVTFSGEVNGTLLGNTVFYINPNKAVALNNVAPTIKPNTGFTAAGWDTTIDRAIQYTDGDVIKAQYNSLGDIYTEEKPGYVQVVFNKGQHGALSGTTTYWIKPGVKVTIPAPTVNPNTGYAFSGWDKPLTQNVTTGPVTITAEYTALEDIIPGDEQRPDGYHTVRFVSDNNGYLTGTTTYYVKPNTLIDLTSQADGIGKNAKVGYTTEGGTWSPTITSTKYTDNATYTFTFKKLEDVIPVEKNTPRPNGYVIVEFVTSDGGSIVGGNKTYYVNPTAGIKPGDDNLPIPKTEPKGGYTFRWWAGGTDALKPITGDRRYVAIFDKIEKPSVPSGGGFGTCPKGEVCNNKYRKEIWYMQGFRDKFRPYDGLTRAEAAEILSNALKADGYKFNAKYPIAYKDIGEKWYTEAVRVTTQAKVFEGYDDGYFRPEKKITRAEWVATIKRFQVLKDEAGNHMNLRDRHWAIPEVEAAYRAGWLRIYDEGKATFAADAPITREEVAAVTNKAFNRVCDRTYIRRNAKNLFAYSDVNPNMWSYDDILCASNTWIHQGGEYRAHWISRNNHIFNVNIKDWDVVQDLFQRQPR